VSRKELFWIAGSAGITLLALGLLANSTSLLRRSQSEEPAAWSQKTISAGYVGSQLKEIDKTHSSLIISYDLEWQTVRTSRGLPSASDPETEADRTPRESLLACMTANRD
jgi:hypothetical protein